MRPYLNENNILYKEFQSQQIEHGKLFKQSVVPIEYREHSLRLENDPILSEHLGLTQMTNKIEAESHWPGVQQDHIRHYCSSLDVCKRILFKGKILKMPIIDMPLIQVDTPFVGAAVVRLFLTILVITFLAVVYIQSITLEKQNVFVFLIRGYCHIIVTVLKLRIYGTMSFGGWVYLAGALAMYEVISEWVVFKLVILWWKCWFIHCLALERDRRSDSTQLWLFVVLYVDSRICTVMQNTSLSIAKGITSHPIM